MPRIVQDSDDDGDLDSAPGSPNSTRSPVQLVREERVSSGNDASLSTNQTSSTGRPPASGTALFTTVAD